MGELGLDVAEETEVDPGVQVGLGDEDAAPPGLGDNLTLQGEDQSITSLIFLAFRSAVPYGCCSQYLQEKKDHQ